MAAIATIGNAAMGCSGGENLTVPIMAEIGAEVINEPSFDDASGTEMTIKTPVESVPRTNMHPR